MVTGILREQSMDDVIFVVQAVSAAMVVQIAEQSLIMTFEKVGEVRKLDQCAPHLEAAWVDPDNQVWELMLVTPIERPDRL